jgi:hypothetical protein
MNEKKQIIAAAKPRFLQQDFQEILPAIKMLLKSERLILG